MVLNHSKDRYLVNWFFFLSWHYACMSVKSSIPDNQMEQDSRETLRWHVREIFFSISCCLLSPQTCVCYSNFCCCCSSWNSNLSFFEITRTVNINIKVCLNRKILKYTHLYLMFEWNIISCLIIGSDLKRKSIFIPNYICLMLFSCSFALNIHYAAVVYVFYVFIHKQAHW